MVRVGMFFPQFDHGRLHCCRLRMSLLQPGIERDHKVLSALVVHVPQTENQRLRSSLQQPAHKANEFISRGDHIEASGASAQNDKFGRQVQVIEVVQAQVRVSQADRGKHRVVLAEIAVGRDVDNPAAAAVGS